jgi:CO/xanthine dehydrogenase FAD-binding subunit
LEILSPPPERISSAQSWLFSLTQDIYQMTCGGKMEMMLKDFQWGKEISVQQYHQPLTIPEALDLLSRYDGKARIIAGGTDVIPLLRRGDLRAEALIDITRLPRMNGVEADGESICLGGLVTHAQVCSSALIRERAGFLAEAAAALGSPQIRNVATVAGNLVSGQPAADTSIPLLALNAKVKIVSRAGEREIPLTQFFLGQGQTAIDCSREILTQIRFPALRDNQGGCFLRLGMRRALALPILISATAITIDPGKKTIKDAAIAIGPVAPTPFRAFKTEAKLRDAPISRESLEMAAQSAFEEANPRSSLLRGSLEYRKEMVKVFVKRGLSRALANAGAAAMEEF